MNPFFIILARDSEHVKEKINEIEGFNVPYRIVCGEKMDHPKVVHREPKGKWDAVNFSEQFIPDETEIVVFNDVDTKIFGLENAVSRVEEGSDLVYAKVSVLGGPQVKFYRIMDPIRKRLHMFASGELLLIRKGAFEDVLPVPPTLAEDSYMLFKAMELGYEVEFCDDAYVETVRTSCAEEERKYKARTTLGIYQALEHADPPLWIRWIYGALPYLAPLFSLLGEDGEAWSEGIKRAVDRHERGAEVTRF